MSLKQKKIQQPSDCKKHVLCLYLDIEEWKNGVKNINHVNVSLRDKWHRYTRNWQIYLRQNLILQKSYVELGDDSVDKAFTPQMWGAEFVPPASMRLPGCLAVLLAITARRDRGLLWKTG